MVGYKSTVVEQIQLPSRAQRERALEEAGYNVFNLSSEDVFVDLLTDSGTGAMSDEQWAALIRGDESYAGSRSFDELESAVEEVMGFERVVPAHQGRGAENVLYGTLISEGDVVPNNTHFDTTRAHVANQGAVPVDCPVDDATDPDAAGDFKGNFSLERARALVEEHGAERIPVVIQTITNNSTAGQPVSVENTRRVREFADEIGATFVIDACRFAENAYFVSRREAEFSDVSVAAVAREQLPLADALVMSGKKDALSNAGGFVATAGSGVVAATHHDDEKPDHDDAEKKAENADDHLETADVHGLYVARLLPQEGIETDASGLAVFQHRDDELTFALTLTNIENTFMSHVHEDEPLGPIAVWLHDFETQDEELVEGTFTGLLDAGTITDDVVQAGRVPEAESQTVQQLVEKIEAGEAYVNVHTEEYPAGELAGQIRPFDVRQLHDIQL